MHLQWRCIFCFKPVQFVIFSKRSGLFFSHPALSFRPELAIWNGKSLYDIIGMKQVLCFLVAFICTASFAIAGHVVTGSAAGQILEGAELIRFVDRTAAPSFVKFRAGEEVSQAEAEQWVRKVLAMRGEDQLELVSSEKDEMGIAHHRLGQTYQGIPVEGAMYLLHFKQGKMVSMNGEFYPNLQVNIQPSLSEAAGLQYALDHVNANLYQWQQPGAEAFLQLETGNPFATFYPQGELTLVANQGQVQSGDFRLAWKFDIYAAQPLSRAHVYVDAHTGEIIWENDRIHTADVVGSAVTAYSGTQTMTADSQGANSYRLREAGRGNGISTYDMNNATNYGSAVDFTDTDNVWNNVNADLDQYATDAHWGAEMTYDFFFNNFGRNSIDGNGFQLVSYIHYDNNYVNAFWDGQRMTYGDGNGGSFTPLTALDVAGHEIAHGLTTFSANLVYQNESGALNESFSDIFGNAIENEARPAQWSWAIGEDMTNNGIRNMQNPGNFGDPDTYQGTNYYTGTADNGGVHTNSGVQNKWYYIMVAGESGTNDLGNAYNVPAQGFTKASAIAFRNLTVYLTPNSDHDDARFFAVQSATDLYGPCGPEVIATTNAWHAVGVGPQFSFSITADFAAATDSFCSVPAVVSFGNASINGGSYLWDFGDGSTSTAISPVHTYNTLGTYTVSLIAFGGPCGNDTIVRSQYIQIDSNITCSITLNPNISSQTQTSCTGILYDTGGPANNYGNNEQAEITIAPTGAAAVTLNFQSFDFEANYDYLYIYDGPSTASPLIGTYSGTNLPNGGSITSSNGYITLVQSTDPGVTASGFALDWTCSLPTTAPSTDFYADNLNSCNGMVNFYDLSTNGASAWQWDFGDGFTSTNQNPQHIYGSNGVYSVQLISTNTIGNDTMVRTAYITVNKPAGPLATGGQRCGPGTVSLNVTGGGEFAWYDAANGGNLLGTGNSYTTPVLTNSGVYYVEESTPGTSQFAVNVGPATPASVGGGGYHNNTSTQYLEFSVLQKMTLHSVYVDPGAAGNRTINLWDNQGTLIRDTTINITNQPQRINIEWNINPGDYRIGGTQMDLFRNNAGTTYPYSLTDVVTITGSSAGNAFYYYLYDWEVSTYCVSQRTSVPATVNPLPTVGVNPATAVTLCPGTSATLNASGASTYQWSTGATGGSLNVNQAGTYYVVGTGTSGCSDTSATVSVTIANPVASITPNGPTTLCSGNTVTLAANAGSAYNWSNGSSMQSITVGTSGTYTVTVTDANGCTAVDSQVVSVTNTPSVNVSSSGGATLCTGNTLTLTATQGNSYVWSDGSTSQSITVSQGGTYDVTVTFPGGCSGSSATPFTVTAVTPPTASIANTADTLCQGAQSTLTASGGTAYMWSTGDSTAAINVGSTGSYSVTVTDANGCTDVASQAIVVNPLPSITIANSNGLDLCDGESTDLSATGGNTYAWNTGPTTAGITVSTSGIYSVTGTDQNGCSAIASATVNVSPNPTADFTASPNGGVVTFTDQSTGGNSYNWDFGDGTGSTQQNPVHVYANAGNYTVTLITTNTNGCSDTISYTFDITLVGVEPGSGDLFTINGVYPNPFQNAVYFDLYFPVAGTVDIAVADVLGRQTHHITKEEVNAGDHRWQWEQGAGLAEGTYIVKISFAGSVQYKKLIHLK